MPFSCEIKIHIHNRNVRGLIRFTHCSNKSVFNACWWQEVLGACHWDESPCRDLGKTKPACSQHQVCGPGRAGFFSRSYRRTLVWARTPSLSHLRCLHPGTRTEAERAKSQLSALLLHSPCCATSTYIDDEKNCHLFKKRWTRSTAVYYKRYFQKNVLLK